MGIEKNYLTVQGWMVTDLKLKGNELLIYALIFGFCQAEGSKFTGSLNYLAEWTNSTKQGVLKALGQLVEKNLIIKSDKMINNIKYCEYFINTEILEKNEGGYSTKFNTIKQSLPGYSTKFNGGIKQSLPGIKQSLPNNIYNNIDNNIENRENSQTFIQENEKENLNSGWNSLITDFVNNHKSELNQPKEYLTRFITVVEEYPPNYLKSVNKDLLIEYLEDELKTKRWNSIKDFRKIISRAFQGDLTENKLIDICYKVNKEDETIRKYSISEWDLKGVDVLELIKTTIRKNNFYCGWIGTDTNYLSEVIYG